MLSSSLAVSIALIALVPIGAFAQADTTPPELLDFDIQTPVVDITTGSAFAVFTGRAVDDFSGLRIVSFSWLRSDGEAKGLNVDTFDSEGNFTGSAPILFGSPPGTYTLRDASVKDLQGNIRIYDLDDLIALGSAPSFEVVRAEIDVNPVVLGFGDVDVGTSISQVVTVTNLGSSDLVVAAISFDSAGGGEFSITSAPTLPAVLLPGNTIDVEISFAPTIIGGAFAILQITSNDPNQGIVEVLLSGNGVTFDPSDTLGTILVFFDDSVTAETLVGSGPGGSGPGRLAALRNMLEAAGDLIAAGQAEKACNQLLDAYLRTDGVTQPPDFVAGTAVPELATQIQDLRISMGCDVVCGDVDRSGSLGPEDADRARDYLLRIAPEPPFELARCSVSGEERACTVADVARMRREEDALSVTLQNNCLSAILDPGSP